jgi:hypothetical protein
MSNVSATTDGNFGEGSHPEEPPNDLASEIAALRNDFRMRLLTANLSTEAVKAGMIDLDGLKLIDLSAVQMGDDDKIIGGQKLMDELRRSKPWLFSVMSSSSPASVPASQPVRQKMALEMTDDEYALARAAVTKYRI